MSKCIAYMLTKVKTFQIHTN